MSIETTESFEPTSITFHGPDGSGKTTIAKSLIELMSNNREIPVVSIGGSTYQEWLTPAVARTTIGSSVRLEKTPVNEHEKTLLYEDIAIACYGYTEKLIDGGNSVVIDSDPYLKRLMWAFSEQSFEDYLIYREYFEKRMSDLIGDSAPKKVVGIDVSRQGPDMEQLYFDRIAIRKSNSDYDPSDLEGVIANISASNHVWSDIITCRRYERLKGIEILSINSEQCGEDVVAINAMRSAVTIRNLLSI